MIFWVENDIEVTYDQLFQEISGQKSIHNLSGLSYFTNILKLLLKGKSFNSMDEILSYLIVLDM